MSTVREVLDRKGTAVASIGGEATVLDAALRMNEERIGSLAIIQEGRLVGILTERDILTRVVAARRDPADCRVEEVMTTEVACCRAHTRLDEARGVMMHRRIRHLPVLNDAGSLLGMISIGDLNAHDNHTQEHTIHLLREYIHGCA